MVLQDLLQSLPLNQSNSTTTRPLSNIHPAVVYRMVSNWTIFKDARVFSAIHKNPPINYLPTWPRDPLPPGMFLLLMNSNPTVRQWAEAHAAKCTIVPMSNDEFVGPYIDVIEIIGRHLTDPFLNSSLPFEFATNPIDLWSGFRVALRQIPIDALGSNTRQYSDFRRIVTKHLHDTGPR